MIVVKIMSVTPYSRCEEYGFENNGDLRFYDTLNASRVSKATNCLIFISWWLDFGACVFLV